MSITRLPEIVYPLTQVNKVNEIVDVLNDNLNMYYSTTNPALTPVEGVCTWTITHNLGTENINCTIFEGDNLVISKVSITSENAVTVSFNSTSNIAAETYKIVIISNGAGSSSGGGTGTSNHAQLTNLDYAHSGHTGFMSDANFLPDGTVINVKTDGSGDFTSLKSAIDSLSGKWSNGVITIQLGNGTFNETSTIGFPRVNITELIIKGNGTSNTTLLGDFNDTFFIRIEDVNYTIQFQNLKISRGAKDSGRRGLVSEGINSLLIVDCAFDNCSTGLAGTSCKMKMYGTSFSNCVNAIVAASGCFIGSAWGVTLSFTNCTKAFTVEDGGIISIYAVTCTYSNVTTKVSQTVGSVTANGLILGKNYNA